MLSASCVGGGRTLILANIKGVLLFFVNLEQVGIDEFYKPFNGIDIVDGFVSVNSLVLARWSMKNRMA